MREEAERSEGGTWLQRHRDLKREKKLPSITEYNEEKKKCGSLCHFLFFLFQVIISVCFFPPFFPRMNISTVAFCCIVSFSLFFPSYCDLFDFFIFPLAVRTIPHEHRLKKQQQTKEKQCCPGSSPLPQLPPSAPPLCPRPSSVVQQARNLEIALKSCHEPDRLFNSWFLSVLCHSLCPSFFVCVFYLGKKKISVML